MAIRYYSTRTIYYVCTHSNNTLEKILKQHQHQHQFSYSTSASLKRVQMRMKISEVVQRHL